MPAIIPVMWEVEIRKIEGSSPAWAKVCETLSRKSPSQERTGGVAQGVGPEFQLSTEKKKFFFFS
jgi:hypothetical protein